jgi:hypothetical protein
MAANAALRVADVGAEQRQRMKQRLAALGGDRGDRGDSSLARGKGNDRIDNDSSGDSGDNSEGDSSEFVESAGTDSPEEQAILSLARAVEQKVFEKVSSSFTNNSE